MSCRIKFSSSLLLILVLYLTSVSGSIWGVPEPEAETNITGRLARIYKLMDFSVKPKWVKFYQYGLEKRERTQSNITFESRNKREITYDPDVKNMANFLAAWKGKNVVIVLPESGEGPEYDTMNCITSAYKTQNLSNGGKYKIVVVDWQVLRAKGQEIAKLALVVACFSLFLGRADVVGIPASNIHIIGNGNAADIAAMASLYMTHLGPKQQPAISTSLLGSITGLDPPSNYDDQIANLDISDASKVIIVYITSWSLIKNNIRTCHFDFFVNHGREKATYHKKAALYYALAREHNITVQEYDKMTEAIGKTVTGLKFGDDTAPSPELNKSYFLQVVEGRGRDDEAITTVIASVLSKGMCEKFKLNK